MAFPEAGAYVFIGFQKTAAKLDIPSIMAKVAGTLRRERVAEHFSALVSPPTEKVPAAFDFQDVDSCVFSGRRLELVQQPKPYQNQKLVLLVVTTPSSPFFEFHL